MNDQLFLNIHSISLLIMHLAQRQAKPSRDPPKRRKEQPEEFCQRLRTVFGLLLLGWFVWLALAWLVRWFGLFSFPGRLACWLPLFPPRLLHTHGVIFPPTPPARTTSIIGSEAGGNIPPPLELG